MAARLVGRRDGRTCGRAAEFRELVPKSGADLSRQTTRLPYGLWTDEWLAQGATCELEQNCIVELATCLGPRGPQPRIEKWRRSFSSLGFPGPKQVMDSTQRYLDFSRHIDSQPSYSVPQDTIHGHYEMRAPGKGYASI